MLGGGFLYAHNKPIKGGNGVKKMGGRKPPNKSSIPYKPSSVPYRNRVSIIYLRRQSLVASSNLPPDIGRAALNCRYTWSCNPRDVLPSVSLPSRWALTPPSHPYPCGRSFSSTLLYPLGYQAVNLRGALRCSDFPPPPCGGSDGACMRRKGTK